MKLLSRTKQSRYPSTSRGTTGKNLGLGTSSRKLRKAGEKLDVTLEKANRLIKELQGAGKAVKENESLAWPVLALTSVYQAELMKIVGIKESDPIRGIHYVKVHEALSSAIALLGKQANSAGSKRGASYRCLTNAFKVLEKGRFIELSQILCLLIKAYSISRVLKDRYARYEYLMQQAEEKVEYYQEQRKRNESSIEQVERLHKGLNEFLENDELLRSLKKTVKAGNRDAKDLNNTLGEIDKFTSSLLYIRSPDVVYQTLRDPSYNSWTIF